MFQPSQVKKSWWNQAEPDFHSENVKCDPANLNLLKIFSIFCLNSEISLNLVALSPLAKKCMKIWWNQTESISLSVLKASTFSTRVEKSQFIWNRLCKDLWNLIWSFSILKRKPSNQNSLSIFLTYCLFVFRSYRCKSQPLGQCINFIM